MIPIPHKILIFGLTLSFWSTAVAPAQEAAVQTASHSKAHSKKVSSQAATVQTASATAATGAAQVQDQSQLGDRSKGSILADGLKNDSRSKAVTGSKPVQPEELPALTVISEAFDIRSEEINPHTVTSAAKMIGESEAVRKAKEDEKKRHPVWNSPAWKYIPKVQSTSTDPKKDTFAIPYYSSPEYQNLQPKQIEKSSEVMFDNSGSNNNAGGH